MAKVTGIGGMFFKTDQPSTAAWFTDVLGLPTESWGRAFQWQERQAPHAKGYTVLGLHKKDGDYFGPSTRDFMINFRVDDLDGLLSALEAKGVTVVKRFPPEPNGKFAHVQGPDGLVLELWEPVANDPYDP